MMELNQKETFLRKLTLQEFENFIEEKTKKKIITMMNKKVGEEVSNSALELNGNGN